VTECYVPHEAFSKGVVGASWAIGCDANCDVEEKEIWIPLRG